MTSYLEIYHTYQQEIVKRSSHPFMRSWAKMSAIRATASSLSVPMVDVRSIVQRQERSVKW